MYLSVKEIKESSPKISAIFVHGDKPELWLQKLHNSGIQLRNTNCFAIPSDKANELLGCLILNTNNEFGGLVQLPGIAYKLEENKLFLPVGNCLFPQLLAEEYTSLFGDGYTFWNPVSGFFQLTVPIHWEENILFEKIKDVNLIEPVVFKFAPERADVFNLVISPDTMENFLEREEVDKDKSLPFDYKKVLKGNSSEIQKMIQYLKEHPEDIGKYGIPLSYIGTEEGKKMLKYKFKKNRADWVKQIFNWRTLGLVLAIVVFVIILRFTSVTYQENISKVETEENDFGFYSWIFAIAIVLIVAVFLLSRRQNKKYRKLENDRIQNKNISRKNTSERKVGVEAYEDSPAFEQPIAARSKEVETKKYSSNANYSNSKKTKSTLIPDEKELDAFFEKEEKRPSTINFFQPCPLSNARHLMLIGLHLLVLAYLILPALSFANHFYSILIIGFFTFIFYKDLFNPSALYDEKKATSEIEKFIFKHELALFGAFAIKLINIVINKFTGPEHFLADSILFFVFMVVVVIIAFSYIINELPHEKADANTNKSPYVLNNTAFDNIRQTYLDIAKDLEEKGRYKQAAFIYIKLLKIPYLGAQALEKGKLWSLAGYVYLNKCKMEQDAARCFVEARMYQEAIHLYKKFEDFEKAGDLYAYIKQDKNAMEMYELRLDQLIRQKQYILANEFTEFKLQDVPRANQILVDGWDANVQSIHCMTRYFMKTSGEKKPEIRLKEFVSKHVPDNRTEDFLEVLVNLFNNQTVYKKSAEDMAYNIIEKKLSIKKQTSSYLTNFNKGNMRFTDDLNNFLGNGLD